VRQAVSFRGQSSRGNRSAVLAELSRRLREERLTVVEGYAHGPHALDLAVTSSGVNAEGPMVVAVDSDVHPGTKGSEPGRDDLRLRHDQLTRMGWVPLRVRTTDVFADPAREVVRVLQALREGEARTP
jgi:very-short-patch-repair endonuclease